MKLIQPVALATCFTLLVSCQTTQTAGLGNQERKRLAALRQQRQQLDEADQNLWYAQQNLLNKDGNPMRRY